MEVFILGPEIAGTCTIPMVTASDTGKSNSQDSEGQMTKQEAFWKLVGIEQFLWTLIPEKSFPEEIPGFRATLDDVTNRRLELQRELRRESLAR